MRVALAASIAELLAKNSLSVPHRPLGSAAETAIPATVVLSKRVVHSSGRKFSLFAMAGTASSQRDILISDNSSEE